MTGDDLIRITAWMSFGAYVAALQVILASRHKPARSRAAAWIWLTGGGLLLAHTLCAFQFKHAWSHSLALADTARQTQALTGLQWGGGLWLNYLAATAWIADAGWWLRHTRSGGSRPRRAHGLVAGFLGFLWLNGLIVFGSVPAQLLGLAGFLSLVWAWIRGRRQANGTPVS